MRASGWRVGGYVGARASGEGLHRLPLEVPAESRTITTHPSTQEGAPMDINAMCWRSLLPPTDKSRLALFWLHDHRTGAGSTRPPAEPPLARGDVVTRCVEGPGRSQAPWSRTQVLRPSIVARPADPESKNGTRRCLKSTAETNLAITPLLIAACSADLHLAATPCPPQTDRSRMPPGMAASAPPCSYTTPRTACRKHCADALCKECRQRPPPIALPRGLS